ncbi:Rpn family recombination-promoting nuclease/putative transposase [Nostoc sp. LEGE 06077]|uniref:Rpn family recombination-promoting nuclease/putative transposase n=1 Tax=Nostoc sp. LEGE 06077 TaxID=915325 RepID=UPI00187DDD02|nr:Rpn family recombination-promoting nuclease/putative transposase [Nostoc sp. LEGE 06077]MBE9209463.1 Rpn family recombination-promoting nuclease/putative transposase [Nostoc sp. LEGE 06077]
MTNENPQTEYDSPWKQILQLYFQDFMLFFFPQAYEQIDWTKEPEFLDKELEQVVRDAELGKHLADKLVKIYLKNGEESWVLIHLEVQAQEDSDLPRRMYTYNYRIYDRYKRSVASLAILGDERVNWRPNQFGYELFGCSVNFQFPVIKLVDYSQRLSELESSHNPFATVVMAHLKAVETRNNRVERKQQKLVLVRRLYEQGFEREDILNLFGFIDWMLTLPIELEQEFWQEIRKFEESRRMQYITSVERIGFQKGIEESQNQIRQVLLKSLALGLKLKFGETGQSLLPEIESIQDISVLEAILSRIETSSNVSQLRQIYQSSTTDTQPEI